jgi:hypothetical protein
VNDSKRPAQSAAVMARAVNCMGEERGYLARDLVAGDRTEVSTSS